MSYSNLFHYGKREAILLWGTKLLRLDQLATRKFFTS